MESKKKDSETNQKIKIAELLKDIQSDEEKKVKKALSSLKTNGDTSIILPLIEHWSKSKNDVVKDQIGLFINDIKQTESMPIIMAALKNESFKNIKNNLLNTIWNSKVDYSIHLPDFVKMAVEGDFMEALECLTIIENMEGPFHEHQFLDAQMHLSSYANQTEKEEKKAHIMSEIALIIKTLEAEHID